MERGMIQGKYIECDGKKIFVEHYGQENEQAILYLHGGPGEGSYDFSYHQAYRLSRSFEVIIIEQRGVCRSEGINPGESLRLEDLIEDCECIRKQLGIKKWSVIGHSFGGYLSVLYALKYPQSIDHLILEGPTFDFALTAKALLKRTASLYSQYGQTEELKKCVAFMKTNPSTRELVEGYMDLSQGLGDRRMEIYRRHNSVSTDFSVYTDDEWEIFYDRSEIHYNLLRDEGRIFQSLLPLLADVTVPMLLLLGKYDVVTCEEQVNAFVAGAKEGAVYTFLNSAHTPHYEEEELFEEVVTKYLREGYLR